MNANSQPIISPYGHGLVVGPLSMFHLAADKVITGIKPLDPKLVQSRSFAKEFFADMSNAISIRGVLTGFRAMIGLSPKGRGNPALLKQMAAGIDTLDAPPAPSMRQRIKHFYSLQS